jgi:TolB protein
VHFTVTCAGTGLTQLAFVRDGEIYLINSDGTGLVQLSNVGPSRPGYAAWATDLAWSPDGRRLAFGIEDDSQSYPAAINIMHADGSTVNRLTDRGSEIWGSASPAWSPDGRVIVFSSFRFPQSTTVYGLFTMEVDGAQDPVMLFGHPGASYHNHTPAWSPDGRKIVFTKPGVEPQFQDLYVMNADGSDVRPLLEAPRSGPAISYRQPAWSPDGQTIVVVACNAAEARCDLSVLNADGSGLRVIAPDGGGSRPTWSPDGRMIAFESASSVRFVRVDGSGNGLIVTNGHSPAWRP